MSGVVAIVGRPNVGKSSLFNRIVGERVSITDDQSGITRDRIYSKATWLTREFKLIDTGGIILRDEPFSKEILAQATLAIDEADVIVMVVDVQTGITQEDIDVIDILHRSDKPVIVAVNKVDNVEIKDLMYEFYSLGCEYVMPISALHGIGVGDLLDLIVQLLPESKPIEKEENVICFSIIGQPNVGKSTLTNAILGEERVIVSDIPGTTRDAIDTRFTRNGKEYVVIDTAGIRKRGKIYERAEKYSIIRAINAIERSDIVVVLLDATRKIQEQDKRIVGYARAYNRGIILVVNKWDLVEKDDKTMNRYVEDIRNSLQFVDFAPIVFLSAKTKSRVHLLLDTIDKVYENFTKYVQTSTLNDVLHDAILLNQPPMYKGNRLKLSYATQSDVAPPTFVLFVNDETHMHFSYLRYLENQVRNTFDFSGSPIKFVLRKKE